MRKVLVLEHISLDGVIQAPGRPDEDTSGSFAYGGWIAPYSDPVLGTLLRRQMNMPFDLLLGRKTFEIWAPYWPQHADAWPGVNAATKYVASKTIKSSDWQPSVFLNGDIAEKVAKIKGQPGPDLHVWGSGDLIQTLIKHDLVDAFWLMVYPITLGSGKRLFAGGTFQAAFKVTESQVTPHGVIVVNYEREPALADAARGRDTNRKSMKMRHTRSEVIKRTIREFELLDDLVAGLADQDWSRLLPRSETKDPWNVKDALAHITHWKADVLRKIKKQPVPVEEKGLNINDGNHLVYIRWRDRSPREVLAWHRQVQKDLLLALQEAPEEWFGGKERRPDWPLDLDGHSTYHRVKDIEQALKSLGR